VGRTAQAASQRRVASRRAQIERNARVECRGAVKSGLQGCRIRYKAIDCIASIVGGDEPVGVNHRQRVITSERVDRHLERSTLWVYDPIVEIYSINGETPGRLEASRTFTITIVA